MKAIQILLVEDNPEDVEFITHCLSVPQNDQYHLVQAECLDEAIVRLHHHTFDVIILDLLLPDSAGLAIFDHLRTTAPTTPVIILSGTYDENLAAHAVQLGAQDYLLKDHLTPDSLTRAIRYALERKRSQEHLAYLAHFDSLTGLPNRALFTDRLKRAMGRARRTLRCCALMFMDLDHFKTVNDSLGHDQGDILLKAVVDRLTMSIRGSDSFARLGGDEFTVLLEDVDQIEAVAGAAERILSVFSAPFYLRGQDIFISASIGITVFPYDDVDMPTLIKHADIAMYHAKEQGGDGYQFYLGGMDAAVSGRLSLLTDLHRAIANQEFLLHYQPQIDLRTGLVAGMESLLRWHHPARGMVLPGDFIPLAEETGLMNQLGLWILRTACRHNRALQENGTSSIPVGVNLSSRQLRQRDLVDKLQEAIDQTGLDPQHLEIELTENYLMDDTERNLATLKTIKQMGIKIALDDFGTGYSSLRYLKAFPIDTLKIDRSFIEELPGDAVNASLVEAMIGIGHSLNLTVVAEGVETPEQASFLRDHGCHQAQGFFFARPQPLESLAPTLGTNSPFSLPYPLQAV